MNDSLRSADTITRFFFDDLDLRGEMISLDKALYDATEHQNLPPEAKIFLAEFLAAAGLLAGILKFEGILTLQVRGDGDIPMLMAEATHNRNLRGIIKVNNGASLAGKPLRELTGNGVLTLTIDPEKGQRYQGIVPLEGDSIAECISHYFTQSEQLPTRLWLFATGNKASGFFLQGLPAVNKDAETTQDNWQTAATLAATLTADESLSLAHEEQLIRLFHEYQLRIAGTSPAQFACSCSQARSENAIASIGEQEAYSLLKEREIIDIDCQFCGQNYALNGNDLDRIFDKNPNGNRLLH